MILIDGHPIELNHFNDGTYYIKYDPRDVYLNPAFITWCYEDDSEAMALVFLTRHIQESERQVILNLPFIPNGRQDRCAAPSDIFTLKYFAEFINSLNFQQVNVYDPHSDVAPALINHCRITYPTQCVLDLLKKHEGAIVVYPDSGSAKKYGPLFQVPYFRGIKVRNFETHKIESFQLVGTEDSIAGKDILIVDDICGTGHTLYKAARELKGLGAKDIYIFVSHCENTVLGPHINGKSLLEYDLITKLYTTNSIFSSNHPKIEIVHHFDYLTLHK